MSGTSPGRMTAPTHPSPPSPCRADALFHDREQLFEIGVGEIQGGWLYLAVVIDLFSRRVVGWAIADHMRTELVLSALF